MPKRELQGRVVSTRNDKTIVVEVERQARHPVYRKYVRVRKRFHVHDAENSAGLGERAVIVESRPLSRLKRWRLVGLLDGSGVLRSVGADSLE